MDAQALISAFVERGVSLTADGDHLVAKPASRLTDADRAAIRAAKAELLAHLRADQEQAEIDRIARLDAERRERDRQAGRGYDFEPAAPSHREFLERTGRPCACQALPPTIRPEPAIPAEVEAEIRRIEAEALRLGWTRERLWGAQFWPIEERGLAAVLDPEDEIAEVTGEYIAILKARRDLLRFRRHAA